MYKWELEKDYRLKKENNPLRPNISQSCEMFPLLRAKCAMSLTWFAAWR